MSPPLDGLDDGSFIAIQTSQMNVLDANAEPVGSAFTMEGGPYEWTKLAFGRIHGGIAAILYWVTNPLWVGGSLAFITKDAWAANIFSIWNGSRLACR